MATAYDVRGNELAGFLKEKIKKVDGISPPEWSKFVKTGSHKQRSPAQEDWWHGRCAAILRTIYVKGPIGTERLRTKYGGRKDRGSRKEHFRKGSGNIIRKCLQQLEKAGFVEKTGKGRKITNTGMKFVDAAAAEMIKNAGKGK